MLKYVLVFVCLLLISIFVTSQYEQHAHNAAAQSSKEGQTTIGIAHPPQTNSNGDKPKWYAPSGELAYSVFSFPNGITVWALFLTLIVIADQTGQTRKAADAALMQANHIVSSERAWVILESDENPIRSHTDNTFGYCWTIKNVGRTPARLIETAAICAKREKLELLNDTPDFSEPSPLRLNDRLLAPGEILRFMASIAGGAERKNLEFNEIIGSYLVAYGYVSYVDCVGRDEHITGFCEYCPHVNAMHTKQTFWTKLDAPPAYTRTT